MLNRKILLALFVNLLICFPALSQHYNFVEKPSALQVYPRSLLTDSADLLINLEVYSNLYDTCFVRFYREGIQIKQDSFALDTLIDDTIFSTYQLKAELANYKLEVRLRNRLGIDSLILEADSLLAGDIYMINGQSNASGRQFSGSANPQHLNSFVRSFGYRPQENDQALVAADTNWYLAEGDAWWFGSGYIGQWALRMSDFLVDSFQVPIAIISGPSLGRPLSHFLRADTMPESLYTNYGRQLYKANKAKVRDRARAMLFFQGESDSAFVSTYAKRFDTLYNDWKFDYPAMEKIFTFQVNAGCGNPPMELREIQRRLSEFYPDVHTMSTTKLPGHDGCHYAYEGGYKEIGYRMARVLARDMYGSKDTFEIDAPEPIIAYFSTKDSTQLSLLLSKTKHLHVTRGAEKDFLLNDTTIKVDSIWAEGNLLRLELSKVSRGMQDLSYTGHSGSDSGWVSNDSCVGIMAFHKFPILPFEDFWELTSMPAGSRFYTRDSLGQRSFSFSGTINSAIIDSLKLLAFKDGIHDDSVQSVIGASDSAFMLSIPLNADTAYQSLALYAFDGPNHFLIGRTDSILIGDALAVIGNVNATGTRVSGISDTLNKRSFIRTIEQEGNGYSSWNVAHGDGAMNSKGHTGQWALKMSAILRDSLGVPIAIARVTDSTSQLEAFLRDTLNPKNPGNYFGELFSKLSIPGIDTSIIACVLNQGDFDTTQAEQYGQYLDSLRTDLFTSYSDLHELIIVQTKNGCGRPTLALRNKQRTFAQSNKQTSLIPTTGLRNHNGCTFGYHGGYEHLGERLALQLLSSMNGYNTVLLELPEIADVYALNKARTLIFAELDSTNNSLSLEGNPGPDFKLENDTTQVLLATDTQFLSKRGILFQLSGPSSKFAVLSYVGHSGTDSNWVFNAQKFNALPAFIGQTIRDPYDSISIISAPQRLEFMPRGSDPFKVDFEAEIGFEGRDFQKVTLQTFRNNTLVRSDIQQLSSSATSQITNLRSSIRPELALYDISILVENCAGIEEAVYAADSIVAGDVFAIYGSKNALALAQDSFPVDSIDGSHFIRTYGRTNTDSVGTIQNQNWHIAQSDSGFNKNGFIGQLGISIAKKLIDENKIPILILNGAESQQTLIESLPSNDTFALKTSYGRLHFRLARAHASEWLRSIIYYPEESDRLNRLQYLSHWDSLENQLFSDFPNLNKIYFIQYRKGCGPSSDSIAQFQAALKSSRTEVFTSNGLDGHDSCTFSYQYGYRDLGQNLSELILRDTYLSGSKNISSPMLQKAVFEDADGTRLRLEFAFSEKMVLDTGAMEYLYFNGVRTPKINWSLASDNSVFIQLDSSVSAASGMSYFGHEGSGPWLKNQKGRSILSFHNFSISGYTPINQLPNSIDVSGYYRKNTLQLSFEKAGAYTIELYNLSGKKVKTWFEPYIGPQSIKEYNLVLAPAMYLISVKERNKQQYIKLLVGPN